MPPAVITSTLRANELFSSFYLYTHAFTYVSMTMGSEGVTSKRKGNIFLTVKVSHTP